MKRSAAFSILLLVAGCHATTDKERWAGKWVEPTPEVMLALAQNHVKGCGEFYQKASTVDPSDYAVACTHTGDGSGRAGWTGYEVFPSRNEVLGPDVTAVWIKFGGEPRPLTKDDMD
jgi:hypothetical protein